MKFLIVSECGNFNGAALRLVKEGNDVRIYFKDPRARKTMKGIIEQVGSVQEGIMWGPDVTVFDHVGQGKLADNIRQNGWKVVGAGQLQDDLELDRSFGVRTLETFGIRTPKTFAFSTFSDAAKFALSHKRRLVFKTTATTFVPSTNDELLNFVSHLKRVKGVDGKCVLQEFVSGTEVSTEVWYANGLPVAYPIGAVELKKFLPGDVGMSGAGSLASIAWGYPTREPRLVQQSLKKIGMLLEKKKYSGPLSINGIVSKGKFYGLGFTAGFRYNTLYALLPLLGEDFGAVLSRIANGDERPMDIRPGFGCALRVSIPPYPLGEDSHASTSAIYDESRDFHVAGAQKYDWGYSVFPHDVYAKETGIFTAGFDGVVAETVGMGETPYLAYEQAERVFRRMEVPNKQARLRDIANISERRLSDLSAMNYDVPSPFPIPVENAMVVVAEKPKPPGESHEKKSLLVPPHMATTTVSMPTKLS